MELHKATVAAEAFMSPVSGASTVGSYETGVDEVPKAYIRRPTGKWGREGGLRREQRRRRGESGRMVFVGGAGFMQ